LVGNHCRLLLQNSSDIFLEIVILIKDYAIERKKGNEIVDAIIERCSGTSRTLTVFDALFSSLQIPNKEVTEDTIVIVKTTSKAAVIAWKALKDDQKKIPPKVHLIEDHVLELLTQYGGLCDFDESLVERNYQRGKRDNAQSRFLQDRAWKFRIHSDWEEMRLHPDVKCTRAKMEESKKRKFKNPDTRIARKRSTIKKLERDEKRSSILNLYNPVEHKRAREVAFQEHCHERAENNTSTSQGADDN